MKVFVAGVRRQNGTAKKTGNAYDMASVLTLTPISAAATSTYNKQGFGFEVAELDLNVSALPSFAHIKFPCELDLVTDMVMRFGRMVPVVVGINEQAK